MKRVRIIYAIRSIAFPLVVFLLGLSILLSTVSIFHVIKNMPSLGDMPHFVSFFISAFGHTEFIVQTALILSLFFGIYTTYRFAGVLKRAPLLAH